MTLGSGSSCSLATMSVAIKPAEQRAALGGELAQGGGVGVVHQQVAGGQPGPVGLLK